MSVRRFHSHPVLRGGLCFGLIAGVVATGFALASILVPFERRVWLWLFDLNGVTMFALCLRAGVRVARHTGERAAGVVASVLASVTGCLLYTLATLVAPYALFDRLVHYPFLHEDFSNSGFASIKEYLRADKGYYAVVGTTVGMLGYTLAFAVLFGACVGWVGGSLGLWRRRQQAA
jgi:hypothetical protein